jgi:hypothetical protein
MPSSALAVWFAQAASQQAGRPSVRPSSILLRAALWSRRGEPLCGAGCTEHPTTHQLKNV